jgi:hypothetical protein
MPCTAHPRGFTDTVVPWDPATDNDPCGKGIVATVNGVNVSAESLCLPHWAAKNGLAALKGVITFGA